MCERPRMPAWYCLAQVNLLWKIQTGLMATYKCHKSVNAQLQFIQDDWQLQTQGYISLNDKRKDVIYSLRPRHNAVLVVPGFCGAVQGHPVYSQSIAELEQLKTSNGLLTGKPARVHQTLSRTVFRHLPAMQYFFPAAWGYILKSLSGSHATLSFL